MAATQSLRFGLALAAIALPAAAAPTRAPLIDNARVTVWDVNLAPGETGPVTPHDQDTVVMFLEGGRIRTVDGKGRVTTATRRFGDAVVVPRGSDAADTLISGGAPAHEIAVVLKDAPDQPVANTAGLPPAFPRTGAVKVLENDRVVVWHYSWRPGRPTPMHFHDKAVVVAYRYDGALRSTTPDGKTVVNGFKAGEVRFNKAGRVHSELLTTPRQSAVMVELK